MVHLSELVSHIDGLLDVSRFRDYCPNGLQVEGRESVTTLVSGVSACQALLEAAIEAGADAVLVHHGWFWKGEDARITGIKRRRIKTLLDAGISLLAYHLPLDAHPELGNNAQLGQRLGLPVTGVLGEAGGPELLFHAELDQPIPAAELERRLAATLSRSPLHIDGGKAELRRIGWCSGAAQNYIGLAAAHGLDAFISGEISEQTVHVAREAGLHYFAAGHHATERYGVRALGECLARRFALRHHFIDIENPV